MKIIRLDKSGPLDSCPSAHYSPKIKAINIATEFKYRFKWLIYSFLSGRPRVIDQKIQQNPRCVLVATGGNLGGAVISLPLIRGVRKRWPRAHLAVISNRQHGLDLIKRAGLGDSFYIAPEISLMRLFFSSDYYIFYNKIKSISPDIFIGNFDFRLTHVLPLRKIKICIGQVENLSQIKNKFQHFPIYDISCTYDPSMNWLEGYWQLLSKIGVEDKTVPTIEVTLKEICFAQELLKSLGWTQNDKLIAIQASVWEKQLFKAWPIEKMAKLCYLLWLKHGFRPLIIGTQGQLALSSYLIQNYPEIPILNGIGKFSIQDLPAVLKNCFAIFTNDSGLMHVSAAVSLPTVALYGMTDPNITWVYGDDARHYIIRRAGCVPCYQRTDGLEVNCPTRHCLIHIEPETVLREIGDLLKDKKMNEFSNLSRD